MSDDNKEGAGVPVNEHSFVQPVPDHCDRITWRGHYYHLREATPPAVMPAAPSDAVRPCEYCDDTGDVHGLEVVAWQYVSEDPLDGGQWMLSEEKPNRSVLRPLVRLTDAQSALESERQAHAAEVERLRGDAERYRLLRRGQHWSVIDGMGYTLRAEQIDAAIDQAIARGKT